ncbi:kinase-like domain-containing protein, partial [Rhodotorula diobovata]
SRSPRSARTSTSCHTPLSSPPPRAPRLRLHRRPPRRRRSAPPLSRRTSRPSRTPRRGAASRAVSRRTRTRRPSRETHTPPPRHPPPPQSASPPLDGTGAGAVSLDWSRAPGPVDPRTYSAVTGLRDIDAFVCEDGEAGKGAYGSVRRAREKGPDGQPIGPELVVKYVIKQRILADCWKKHKVLGPIPIEVHVLDHLRRVPYEPRPRLNYLSRRSGGTRKSIGPGQHVRRDSAPQLDLWHGGADGAPVQTGHPNVCPLLDFWEDAHYYYLVMPSATAEPTCSANPRRGQDLFDFVDAHPDGLSPEPLQRILAQIADAVCFLHEHSIVHRDIKDENVVLDPEGNVRLIDFGSAAYVREGRKFDTFSGTLDFAAPEVLKGARYSGKEQDIWALGVLGYVLICGECPFWSPDEAMRGLSPGSRALAALEAKATAGEGIMAHAVDLVRRCLEINAADRPCADAVCDHAFFVGAEEGWSGERGWERAAGGGAE